jgi:hypothetical protein
MKTDLGRVRLRRLSRVLMLIESGQLVKRDGKMVLLDEKDVPPMLRFRVCVAPDGRATIGRGEPLQIPRKMPRLFADFRLPGEK